MQGLRWAAIRIALKEKKAPRRRGFLGPGTDARPLELLGYDVDRAGPFRALFDVVGNALPFGQRLESAALNGAVVHEDVFGVIGRCDEAEAFVVAEPLDCTCSHFSYL